MFWQDKHVLITGGSSGIGAALARELAARGARLGLIGRSAERLSSVAAEVAGLAAKRPPPASPATSISSASPGSPSSPDSSISMGLRVAWAVADVRSAEATAAAVRRLEAELGPCEVLIANAGLHQYSPGFDLAAEAANEVLAVNVQGVVNAAAAVLPGMLARGRGRVCTLASIAGLIGLPEVGAYSASKAAVIALSESWRLDLFPRGIRVTCVCPGFVDTPLIRNHDPRALKFVLPADEAARRIARAVEEGRALVGFPWPLWTLGRLARLVPRGWYRWSVRRILARLKIIPPAASPHRLPAGSHGQQAAPPRTGAPAGGAPR